MKKSSANPVLSQPASSESKVLETAFSALKTASLDQKSAKTNATRWVKSLREAGKIRVNSVENMLRAFPLKTDEGKALMTLAEALIRTPDHATRNQLIADKIDQNNWIQNSDNSTGKAAGLGLMVGNKSLNSPLSHIAKPLIRSTMLKAMSALGTEFIMGQDIHDAFIKAVPFEKKGQRISYDMLGEGARTSDDADLYFKSYIKAIHAIGARNHSGAPQMHNVNAMPGISVKLSALHPRYEWTQRHHCVSAISNKLQELMRAAAKQNITLTVDAEESWRLALSLDIIAHALENTQLDHWKGFGLAVQAYNKHAGNVVDWAAAQAEKHTQIIQVRLVKGAYWDTEIKRAQELGQDDFPVFTRKSYTDTNYLYCALKLMRYSPLLYPLYATHNAATIASILIMAKQQNKHANFDFEFQRLHGMGADIYDLIKEENPDLKLSIYAPVGEHKELLPYLVRRILENGANSSFVNHVLDSNHSLSDLLQDPMEKAQQRAFAPHPAILPSKKLFNCEGQKGRENSDGYDPQNNLQTTLLLAGIAQHNDKYYQACSIISSKDIKGENTLPITNPADKEKQIGTLFMASEKDVHQAFDAAKSEFINWKKTPVKDKAKLLRQYADLLHQNQNELLSLLINEAGKTLPDAHAELREAIDFCRYYANQASEQLAPIHMPGPTGEDNILSYEGRGVFACISPWNFPLAIFTGQIAAALVTGNCVIAKPAPQTSIIAHKAVSLWHKAGLPKNAVQLIIGDRDIGEYIIQNQNIAGVAFTGSTNAARNINQTLALGRHQIVPLIAETGGQNAMIIDSTALLEQAIDHIIHSAFGSAGQRCSALRVVYIQNDIFDPMIRLLQGAMQELTVGDPADPATDIGPIIDEQAKGKLNQHISNLRGFGRKIAESPINPNLHDQGYFIAPRAYEIENINDLTEEHFGPILHVIRYNAEDLDQIIDDINNTKYGLTLGIQSRIKSKINTISRAITAGNVYVNRGMTGAVVGSQPFGGQGRSGTGPKAGGPNYLKRFSVEKTLSIDTTAAGGNASLACLSD